MGETEDGMSLMNHFFPCPISRQLSILQFKKPSFSIPNQRSSATTEDYYKSQTPLGVLASLYSCVFPYLPPFDKQLVEILRNLFSQMLISDHSCSFEAHYQTLISCPHSYLSETNHFITWTSASTHFPLVNPSKTIKFFIKLLLLIYYCF